MHHKDNEGIDRKLKTKKNNWSERLFVCTIQITDERCLYYSAEHDSLHSALAGYAMVSQYIYIVSILYVCLVSRLSLLGLCQNRKITLLLRIYTISSQNTIKRL